MITTLRLRTCSRWTLALCAALLAACGGGGYGGGGGGGGGGGCGAYSSCTPTVLITNMAGTVSGTVALTASAMAAGTYTVMNVQFRVDGAAVGAPDASAPYSYNWDSSTVADGVHLISAVVTDNVGQTATSASVSLTVSNNATIPVTLSSGLLFPTVTTAATGTGSFTVNTATGQISGNVMLSGITVTSAEIGDAYAGSSSVGLFALTVNAINANEWDVPAAPNATILTSGQLADFAAGKLYVLVRTAANPNGELRAQLLPSGFTIKVATLTGGAEVPAVVSGGTGLAVATVDSSGMTAAVHVNMSGITATGAELDTGAVGVVGALLVALDVDALDPNHYFKEGVTLTSQNVTDYTNGLWYANVLSAANASGEMRGQIVTSP